VETGWWYSIHSYLLNWSRQNTSAFDCCLFHMLLFYSPPLILFVILPHVQVFVGNYNETTKIPLARQWKNDWSPLNWSKACTIDGKCKCCYVLLLILRYFWFSCSGIDGVWIGKLWKITLCEQSWITLRDKWIALSNKLCEVSLFWTRWFTCEKRITVARCLRIRCMIATVYDFKTIYTECQHCLLIVFFLTKIKFNDNVKKIFFF
jgi:hypothetical protein